MRSGHRSSSPDRPFFLYLAFGACHGPHQVPEPYRSKYRGRYDDGWDETRRRWHERQQQLGIIPPGTGLAPRNPDVPAWDELPTADRERLARFHDVYAAFRWHTSHPVGRRLAALQTPDLGCAERRVEKRW